MRIVRSSCEILSLYKITRYTPSRINQAAAAKTDSFKVKATDATQEAPLTVWTWTLALGAKLIVDDGTSRELDVLYVFTEACGAIRDDAVVGNRRLASVL